MDSAQVVRRFAQERAVLAGLDHAGIARLLDGGTTPDGRPFLVLDLVPGVPITVYADRHHATVEGRVRLVVQVCEAVAHAHRRLVVHRDLKPSNVLVADPEVPGDAPRVTLLDFGVAHLLRPDAAAEQLAGEAVTTATDVYALGVVPTNSSPGDGRTRAQGVRRRRSRSPSGTRRRPGPRRPRRATRRRTRRPTPSPGRAPRRRTASARASAATSTRSC